MFPKGLSLMPFFGGGEVKKEKNKNIKMNPEV